jgi:hypothetical protein
MVAAVIAAVRGAGFRAMMLSHPLALLAGYAVRIELLHDAL